MAAFCFAHILVLFWGKKKFMRSAYQMLQDEFYRCNVLLTCLKLSKNILVLSKGKEKEKKEKS